MLHSTEQHLALAKLIRKKATGRTDNERFLRMSNSFVVCARLAAKERGGIQLIDFEWSSVAPDWRSIEQQIAKLAPINIEAPPLAPDGT
jgi:hypothetical protein